MTPRVALMLAIKIRMLRIILAASIDWALDVSQVQDQTPAAASHSQEA